MLQRRRPRRAAPRQRRVYEASPSASRSGQSLASGGRAFAALFTAARFLLGGVVDRLLDLRGAWTRPWVTPTHACAAVSNDGACRSMPAAWIISSVFAPAGRVGCALHPRARAGTAQTPAGTARERAPRRFVHRGNLPFPGAGMIPLHASCAALNRGRKRCSAAAQVNADRLLARSVDDHMGVREARDPVPAHARRVPVGVGDDVLRRLLMAAATSVVVVRGSAAGEQEDSARGGEEGLAALLGDLCGCVHGRSCRHHPVPARCPPS